MSSMQSGSPTQESFDDGLDVRQLVVRLGRGLSLILGLGLLGIVAGLLIVIVSIPSRESPVTTQVTFSFTGLDRGLYPDRSSFQAEDLRSPDIVLEVLRRRGIDNSEGMQSRIRNAISIEGRIPAEILRQRDRLRAGGQTPPPYVPDEYVISLQLPTKFPLSFDERRGLLNELVNVYRDKFLQTYGTVPANVGNGVESLKGADYYEYEFIMTRDLRSLMDFLDQQIEADKTFRSQKTGLSFADLLKQTQLFARIRTFETLGLIRTFGISRDRNLAIAKLNYYLSIADDRLNEALAQEKNVKELLKQTQERNQSYILGVKSQASQPRTESSVLDQGLIDSLLANDAYNFLMRKALDAGSEVKRLQSDRDQLVERRQILENFLKEDASKQSAVMEQVQASLQTMETGYAKLVSEIKLTFEDYTRQKFANVIRLTAPMQVESNTRPFLFSALIGGLIGVALGSALSLLGLFPFSQR